MYIGGWCFGGLSSCVLSGAIWAYVPPLETKLGKIGIYCPGEVIGRGSSVEVTQGTTRGKTVITQAKPPSRTFEGSICECGCSDRSGDQWVWESETWHICC